MFAQIFGGGTIMHVRSHFALCAPAYGQTARKLYGRLKARNERLDVRLELTRMAAPESRMETNADVADVLNNSLLDPELRVIFFNVALCDFEGQIGGIASGKYAERLQSRAGEQVMTLTPADKLLGGIKQRRPDVFLIGSKTTTGETRQTQVAKAERQISETGADLVLANDTQSRCNLLVSQAGVVEESREVILELLARKIQTELGGVAHG